MLYALKYLIIFKLDKVESFCLDACWFVLSRAQKLERTSAHAQLISI